MKMKKTRPATIELFDALTRSPINICIPGKGTIYHRVAPPITPIFGTRNTRNQRNHGIFKKMCLFEISFRQTFCTVKHLEILRLQVDHANDESNSRTRCAPNKPRITAGKTCRTISPQDENESGRVIDNPIKKRTI